MPKTRPRRIPSFRLHKPSGRGFVELDGHRHYLGAYDDPATRIKYHEIMAERARGVPEHSTEAPEDRVTIHELVDAYITECKRAFQGPDGPTSSLTYTRYALRPLLEIYGDAAAEDFGPKALRTVRQRWIDGPPEGRKVELSVTTINQYQGIVRRLFKFGLSHEMFPPGVCVALNSVPGVRRGRGIGRDPKSRKVVPQAHIDLVLTKLSGPLRAVVQLQLLSGARPSELLNLKRGDLECPEVGTWVADLKAHKCAYQGRDRCLCFGPQARAVLRPFLVSRLPDAYLFSPKEADAERYAAMRERSGGKGRRPNQKPSPRKTPRTLGDRYTADTYRNAVKRACKACEIEVFTPYDLRHTSASHIERTEGMAATKAVLGHASLSTTLRYLHNDRKTAEAWAEAHG